MAKVALITGGSMYLSTIPARIVDHSLTKV